MEVGIRGKTEVGLGGRNGGANWRWELEVGIGGGNWRWELEVGAGPWIREVAIEVAMEVWEGSQHCLYEITL